ncbi:MAG: hypothetical protein HEQ39_12615 [Rhizobacter sp.]
MITSGSTSFHNTAVTEDLSVNQSTLLAKKAQYTGKANDAQVWAAIDTVKAYIDREMPNASFAEKAAAAQTFYTAYRRNTSQAVNDAAVKLNLPASNDMNSVAAQRYFTGMHAVAEAPGSSGIANVLISGYSFLRKLGLPGYSVGPAKPLQPA